MTYFYETEERILMRNIARDFVEQELLPIVQQVDTDPESVDMKALYHRAGDLGILGLAVPEEYGGTGADYTTVAMVNEEIGKALPVMGLNISVHSILSGELIMLLGSDELKKRYLPDLASGKTLFACCSTEPIGALNHTEWQVSATEEDDCYVINGSKMLISQAGLADKFVVLAVTTRPVDPATRFGISAFVVDAHAEGVTIGHHEHKFAMHGSASTTVTFNNVRVPKEDLIGERDKGAAGMMISATNEFMTCGPMCLGMAEHCFDVTLEYARQRIQRGKNLLDNYQVIAHKFSEMWVKIEMLRATCYNVFDQKDKGKFQLAQGRMLKVIGSKIAMEVAAECMQVYGGLGCISETGIDRYWRDAKMLHIAGEASEALMDNIADFIKADKTDI